MTIIGQNDVLAMLASELDAAQVQLEKLGMVLIADPKTASQHIRELQSLDHVSQRCASVASILRSQDIRAASYAATLESITARLHHASGAMAPSEPTDSGDVDWYN